MLKEKDQIIYNAKIQNRKIKIKKDARLNCCELQLQI